MHFFQILFPYCRYSFPNVTEPDVLVAENIPAGVLLILKMLTAF